MSLILLTFGLLVLIVLAMAVGVIVQKKAMASSCGGLGSVGIDKVCDCDDPCDKRKKRLAKEQVWKDNQIL
ncbi:Probable exported or periplasmic protein in ApbE locus [Pseudoalteromonas luteoviolacea B = ATCC 29581]|nr:Probable exported or periplasmic protein in ApbE locus [Pseudoalteromonas luteoviolacea B = ATCC 29581]